MSRHDARILALQVLYEADMAHHPAGEVLSRHLLEAEHADKIRDYASELVSGVIKHQAELDATIGRCAPEFPVEQLSAIDRNILRIALCEIQAGDVPLKVAIDEAVGIAKQFGSDNSGRFVNGVLGTAVSI